MLLAVFHSCGKKQETKEFKKVAVDFLTDGRKWIVAVHSLAPFGKYVRRLHKNDICVSLNS